MQTLDRPAVTGTDPTTVAIDAMTAARGGTMTEAALVAVGVKAVAGTSGTTGALVDSDRIAEKLLAWRVGTDRTTDRTRVYDYTKHLLREAAHCCRHAIERGSHYRVHPDEVCSGSCTERFAHTHGEAPTARYGLCDTCFMWLPATGVCGMCE